MKRIAALLLLLCTLSATAQNQKAQAYADNLCQPSRGDIGTAVWGILAKDGNGKVLVSLNPDMQLTPASNMKLITTGCALHSLGKDYRFGTSIAYTGEIKDGILEGDIYIVGGGDPTLASADSIALKPDALFWKWKSAMREAGINAIHGRIIGDGRFFEGNLENSSWEYDDMGTDYGTGGNGLSFYENAQYIDVSAGPTVGSPVNVQMKYPETPWMHFIFRGTTGPDGAGNSLYMYTTDLAPYAEMRGVFGIDRKPKTENCSNKFGAMTCAYYFWKNLTATGWVITGGYSDIDRGGYIRGADFVPTDKAADEMKTLTTSWSPTLELIARETNHRSDNFYAETLLRTMGKQATGTDLYDSCYVAEKEVLEDLKVDTSRGIQIEDGSGLSRHNFISPDFFVRYLTAMESSPAFPTFLKSLPQPGSNGTLRSVLSGKPETLKKRIWMKSGSMDGVLCYSGYIMPVGYVPGQPVPKDAIVFSFLSNNCMAPVSEVRACIMEIITRLAE